MTPAGFRPFADLIDRLYAAALRPEGWPDFLEAATAMFGGTHAFVSELEDRRRPINYFGLPRPGRSTHPVGRYVDVIAEDPRQHVFNMAVGRVTHCRMGLSDQQVRTSRAYREYLNPLGFEYTLHAHVLASGNVTHAFGVNRNQAGRPFGAADCDLMNELMPHLKRAFEIQRALRGTQPALPSTPAKGPEAVAPDIRLRRLFCMPPAQARLAVLLLEGRTITEAANTLGLTVGSARQYLRGIFHATGVRRQADFIRVASEALRR